MESEGHNFEVAYANWKSSRLIVTDLSTHATVYDIKLHCRTPNMVVHKVSPSSPTPTDDNVIGTGAVNYLSTQFSFELHRQSFEMRAQSWKNTAYAWKSPAAQGRQFSWRGLMEIVCMDDRQMAVARIKVNWVYMKKIATFEITDLGATMGEAFIDELVASGLCVLMKYQNPALFNKAFFAGGVAGTASSAVATAVASASD